MATGTRASIRNFFFVKYGADRQWLVICFSMVLMEKMCDESDNNMAVVRAIKRLFFCSRVGAS